MSRTKKALIIIISVIMAVILGLTAIGFYQMYKDYKRSTAVPVDRSEYVLQIFDLSTSSGNAFAPEEGHSTSFFFFYETLAVNSSATGGDKRIELDATERKNLEADLLAVIEAHNLHEWDGYDVHEQVMDASNGFSLRVEYADETEIKASGGFAFPDNYDEVYAAVKEVFLKYV